MGPRLGLGGVGVPLLLGSKKFILGPVDLFVHLLDLSNAFFYKSYFGEIDLTNDHLNLKINANLTSWDYAMPIQEQLPKAYEFPTSFAKRSIYL